jgi:hypothetical protein
MLGLVDVVWGPAVLAAAVKQQVPQNYSRRGVAAELRCSSCDGHVGAG